MTDTRSHHQYLHVADGPMRVTGDGYVEEVDPARVSEIVAEMRALELLRALRNAVNGAPHWRLEATNLLILVDGGVPPRSPHTPHHHDEAA